MAQFIALVVEGEVEDLKVIAGGDNRITLEAGAGAAADEYNRKEGKETYRPLVLEVPYVSGIKLESIENEAQSANMWLRGHQPEEVLSPKYWTMVISDDLAKAHFDWSGPVRFRFERETGYSGRLVMRIQDV